MSRPATSWTQNLLSWANWVPAVTDEDLTDAQRTVLEAFPAQMASSPYYRTLVAAPAILDARTRLFNASLRGDARASRADRELAAVGSSRQTGCVYCASIHARAYSGMVRERDTVQQVLDHGVHARIAARERAIVEFSAAIADKGPALGDDDVAPLQRQGMSDEEIFDVALSAAIFANANRLMLTLGQGVED